MSSGRFNALISRVPWVGPAVVALVVLLPCRGFPYLWDDCGFLTNAMQLRLTDLLPGLTGPTDPFYRPISRGVYFAFLDALGPFGETASHVINAALWIAVVALVTRLGCRLRGLRFGVLAGIAVAGFGATPLLVYWASGAQDLFAVAFVLGALNLEVAGKRSWAVLLSALAILSKETAVVVLPAVALSRWVLGQSRTWPRSAVAAYATLAATWLAIHPGIHRLMHNGLRSGATDYIGLEHPGRWPLYLAKYSMVQLNAVPGSPSWPLVLALLPFLAAAAAVAVVLIVRTADPPVECPRPSVVTPTRTGILAALLAVPPLMLSATFVRTWVPYYAAFAAPGSALALALLGERMHRRALFAAVSLYVVLGAWPRSASIATDLQTEANFRSAGRALSIIRANFRRVAPAIARSSEVLCSVQVGSVPGLYTQIYYCQILRVWYHDPTITTLRPDWMVAGSEPDMLLWVDERLNVFRIDLSTLRPAGTSEEIPYDEYQRTIRYYTRGLAASGATDLAVAVQLRMPEQTRADYALDRRLATMYLYHAHRDTEAEELLPPLPRVFRANALAIVATLLEDQPPEVRWEDPAIRAFGLRTDDPDVWLYLLEHAAKLGRRSQAIAYGEHVLALRAGDPRATRLLGQVRSGPESPRYVLPAPPTSRER